MRACFRDVEEVFEDEEVDTIRVFSDYDSILTIKQGNDVIVMTPSQVRQFKAYARRKFPAMPSLSVTLPYRQLAASAMAFCIAGMLVVKPCIVKHFGATPKTIGLHVMQVEVLLRSNTT